MSERILSDRATEVAGDVLALLHGLPLRDGCSVLISILAATLNGQARDDDERKLLAQATAADLLETMRAGARGDLTEGRLQ